MSGKQNGVMKVVRVVLTSIVVMSFIVVGKDLIMMLFGLGRIGEAMTVAMLYLTTLGYVVKDFLTSGRETSQIDAPAGCKQKISAEIICD